MKQDHKYSKDSSLLLYQRWTTALSLARKQSFDERDHTIQLLAELQREAAVALEYLPDEPALLIITARPIEQHLCLLLSGKLRQCSVL